MARRYTLKDGSRTRYGYGLQIGTLRGREAIEHGGGINGFSTYALSLPRKRIYVVVLCNSDNPEDGTRSTWRRRLAAIAIGKPFPERTAITVDPTVLARYAGMYRQRRGRRTGTVTVEGSKIYMQREGGRRWRSRPHPPPSSSSTTA